MRAVIIIYWIAVVAIVYLYVACDVRVEHYEDGSGRITYCIPGTLCNE